MNTWPRSNRQRREPSSKRIFARQDAASMTQAALREATAAEEQRKIEVKTLECQTELEAEVHVEEEQAAEFKNEVQLSKIEQPLY